jgi:hypothetical protein
MDLRDNRRRESRVSHREIQRVVVRPDILSLIRIDLIVYALNVTL